MKVYRIWNNTYNCWQYTNNTPNGIFLSLTTVKKL